MLLPKRCGKRPRYAADFANVWDRWCDIVYNSMSGYDAALFMAVTAAHCTMILNNSSPNRRTRIGLFTDTYRPTINGISVVVDTLRRHMEAQGYEVFVVCPVVPAARHMFAHDEHVVHVPSVKGWPYREYDLSFFWPPRLRRRIIELQLDAIMFFTPGQIGLMAMDIGRVCHIPVIAQHSTDLEEYVVRYMGGPLAAIGLMCGLPAFAGISRIDWRTWRAAWLARTKHLPLSRNLVRNGLGLWYSMADGVIALSRKSKEQIRHMPYCTLVPVAIIPTGVDALPTSPAPHFRAQHGIAADAPLLLYVGRIGREKGLDLIIPMMERIMQDEPRAIFAFVGDFDYRKHLQAKAAKSLARNNIIFTGKIPRQHLGDVYAAGDMFVFPSTTDTQGLVLHEAAQAGLPIIMTDGTVTEVVRDRENGLIVANSAEAFATAALDLIRDSQKRQVFACRSSAIARQYSEAAQTAKALAFVEQSITAHTS